MLPLAHLGIGVTLARPFTRRLPIQWVLLGTMLPDLIDKPAFFAMGIYARLTNGGWVPGKRGVAHTLVFLLFVAIAARFKRSSVLWAITAGVVTHLLLDILSKAFGPQGLEKVFAVLFWPCFGFTFPTLSYGVHGMTALAFEAAGAVLLIVLYRQSKQQSRWVGKTLTHDSSKSLRHDEQG